MLDNRLLARFPHEPPNETGIPEFACDAQVLAASHQGVGFAAFGCGRDAVRVEVLLFAARYADESGLGWLVALLKANSKRSRKRLAFLGITTGLLLVLTYLP